MPETERTNENEGDADATKADVGDVETAGETTAAAAIHGPIDDSPVGSDSLAKIKIADARESIDNEQD